MIGYPVGELIASSRLPIEKSTAISMPKPRVPFKNTLHSIEAGTTFDGFRISSDICAIISAATGTRTERQCTCIAPSTPRHIRPLISL